MTGKEKCEFLRTIRVNMATKNGIPYTPKELEGTILHDKKIRNSNINLIIPYDLGDVRIEKIKITDLSSILNIALK